jgi:hypothetical protein
MDRLRVGVSLFEIGLHDIKTIQLGNTLQPRFIEGKGKPGNRSVGNVTAAMTGNQFAEFVHDANYPRSKID